MTMTLKVRNVLGVRKADLPLEGLMLIAGMNAAGKSSLLQAAAAAFRGTADIRGNTTKKGAAALLTEGAENGSTTLDDGRSQVRVSFPGGQVEQSGRPKDYGSDLGLGIARFVDVDAKNRLPMFVNLFKARPVEADLDRWLRANPGVVGKEDIGNVITATWEMVDQEGWDIALRHAAEFGTKTKGRWEQVTGARFGSVVAANWFPPSLLADDEYTEEGAENAVSVAQSRLDDILAFSAIGAAEYTRLNGLVESLEVQRADVAAFNVAYDKASAELEDLSQQRGGIAKPDVDTTQPCPWCTKRVLVFNGKLSKPSKTLLSAAEVDELGKRSRQLDEKIVIAKGDVTKIGQNRAAAMAKVSAGEEAEKRLAELADQPTVSEKDENDARDHLLAMQRRRDAVKALFKSRSIFTEWQQNEVIVSALKPDGVRKDVVQRRLADINNNLAELSSLADTQNVPFLPVALDDDLEPTYGGRIYRLLSESEQWRANLVLATLFCQREDAAALLVDRFDVLVAPARPGVLKMLSTLKRPVLLAMTAKQRDDVPRLAAARIGSSYWIEAGVLSVLGLTKEED